MALGVAVGTAALTGALLVGDSMRGSLREAALGRLGRIDHALVSSRFFREALATEVGLAANRQKSGLQIAPILLLSGGVTHAGSLSRASRVGVIGVDDRFWSLRGDSFTEPPPELTGRVAALNEPLAEEIGASIGDDILLRLGKASAISPETLLGRRDDTTATLRLTVSAIIPARDLGAFGLNPRQVVPKNIYVPLAALQRTLDKRDRVNALLVGGQPAGTASLPSIERLQQSLESSLNLEDVGLRLRVDEQHGYVSLESDAMLIEPALEQAAREMAKSNRLRVDPVLVHLANRIATERSERDTESKDEARGIPYSVVAAVEPAMLSDASFEWVSGDAAAALQPGEIVLNEWAADDLGAKLGEPIAIEYYLTGQLGRLETMRSTFTLRGVVAMKGAAIDPGFTPEYPGVTDTQNLADWDPPFPMDLKVVRDKDEAYWDRYRATPKAFLVLEEGQRLWAREGDRFGRLTSIRFPADRDGGATSGMADLLAVELRGRLNAARLDMSFEPVRNQLGESGAGTTDFGMLFVGFSFFLIASAAMLVALLFRLGVERRSHEVGLLRAVGFAPRSVAGVFVAEGAVLAVAGSAVGLVGAIGYARLMLGGLRTLWSDAVSAPFLTLHITPGSMAIGFVAGLALGLISIVWSLRGLTKLSVRSLLAGVVASGRTFDRSGSTRWARRVAIMALALAVLCGVLPTLSDALPAAPAFFLSGAAMLVGCLALLAAALRSQSTTLIAPGGRSPMGRLGVRNARRRYGRSILTAGLIASATFLIAALEAFHLDAGTTARERTSGTGGFALYAESAAGLLYGLDDRSGREALNIADPDAAAFDDMIVAPMRLRPGDESSCLNLYRPTRPRILGVTDTLIARGGFRFSKTMAETQEEQENPWLLLRRRFDDGAIPVIGDEAAVLWQLHLGLGKDLLIEDDGGREVRLRFVALLSGSMLQDEMIVSEADFVRLFPSISGYAFFLIDTPVGRAKEVEALLERELGAFAFDVGSTTQRLNTYLAVQNTYLSTFQMLGGFGLILGTAGLAAVMLRNVWERRGELALLRALGFSRAAIGWLVLAENAALLVAGLAAGVFSALVAIAPHIATRASSIPWVSLGLTLLAVFAVGMIAGVAAIVPTVRAPLIGALRAE